MNNSDKLITVMRQVCYCFSVMLNPVDMRDDKYTPAVKVQ